MTFHLRIALVLGTLAAATTACDSTQSIGSPTCLPIALPASPPLLYPIPGATGVPDGDFALITQSAESGSLSL